MMQHFMRNLKKIGRPGAGDENAQVQELQHKVQKIKDSKEHHHGDHGDGSGGSGGRSKAPRNVPRSDDVLNELMRKVQSLMVTNEELKLKNSVLLANLAAAQQAGADGNGGGNNGGGGNGGGNGGDGNGGNERGGGGGDGSAVGAKGGRGSKGGKAPPANIFVNLFGEGTRQRSPTPATSSDAQWH